MGLEDQRREYKEGLLVKRDLLKDPFAQVSTWIDEAIASHELEPTAACLATSTKEGKVSSRMVLLKHFGPDGAYFFTHKTSKKGMQLTENPYASLTLYWKALERQVILEGEVVPLSDAIVSAYFAKRPRKSQLGALASKQGDPLSSEEALVHRFVELEKQFEGKPIPVPPTWGGYALHPNLIEIWQGRPSRLHDHFSYKKQNHHWQLERISP